MEHLRCHKQVKSGGRTAEAAPSASTAAGKKVAQLDWKVKLNNSRCRKVSVVSSETFLRSALCFPSDINSPVLTRGRRHKNLRVMKNYVGNIRRAIKLNFPKVFFLLLRFSLSDSHQSPRLESSSLAFLSTNKFCWSINKLIELSYRFLTPCATPVQPSQNWKYPQVVVPGDRHFIRSTSSSAPSTPDSRNRFTFCENIPETCRYHSREFVRRRPSWKSSCHLSGIVRCREFSSLKLVDPTVRCSFFSPSFPPCWIRNCCCCCCCFSPLVFYIVKLLRDNNSFRCNKHNLCFIFIHGYCNVYDPFREYFCEIIK